MVSRMMQNKLLRVDAELEKDQFKSLKIIELNDTEKFTLQVLRYIEFTCSWAKF